MKKRAKELWNSPVPVVVDMFITMLVYVATGDATIALFTFLGALLVTYILYVALMHRAEKQEKAAASQSIIVQKKGKSKDGENITAEDWKFIKHSKCPNCEKGTLYEGASGGMSTNYRCDTCGQGYNLVFWGDGVIVSLSENIGIDKQYIRKEQYNEV